MTTSAATATATNGSDIRPFVSTTDESALDDLRMRLERTRWPDELPGTAWEYGVALDRVRDLVARWRSGFDWRAHEARLNAFPQYTTPIDAQRVHFIHERSNEPGAMPLLLTHGWPGSVFEFVEMIGPLVDPAAHGGDPREAFHVVIPSMPGYGFSGPTDATGWDVRRIAGAWATLMARLGYDRYIAQGGDWGARISPALARLDPEHVAGLHVNGFVAFPSGDPAEMAALTEGDRMRLGGLQRWNEERSGYAQMQATRPQTLAYALVDSPVGQLAWNLEWFDDYGHHVGAIADDTILANVTLYWLTKTAGSAARLYRESAALWGQKVERSSVPTALAVFPGDATVRPFAEREHEVVRWTEFDRGSHFAALQAPDLLVDDLRAFLAQLRQGAGR